MADKPIGFIDTSYLFHLAEASRLLGSTAPIDLMFEKYDLRVSDQVLKELNASTFGLEPTANNELIAEITAKINKFGLLLKFNLITYK